MELKAGLRFCSEDAPSVSICRCMSVTIVHVGCVAELFGFVTAGGALMVVGKGKYERQKIDFRLMYFTVRMYVTAAAA